MLRFTMHMPFYLMAFYGSIMIILVFLMRGLLKNKLPKFVFPIIWSVILLRLLIPFSLSSPLTLKIPALLSMLQADPVAVLAEDSATVVRDQSGDASVTPGLSRQLDQVMLTQITETSTGVAYAYDYAGNSGILSMNWYDLLPALYFFGLAVTVGVLSIQKYHYARKLKNRLLVEHNETINSILREMGMGQVLIFTSDDIASPMVCGLCNPVIFLPTRMNFKDTVLLRNILTHEATHIRRHDNWIKAVMLAALCIHWFNPLVWIMAKCLSSDLESACDAAVLKNYDEEQRKGYAFSLLAMAITGNKTALLYSAFSKTEVERRIKSVIRYKKASFLVLAVSVLFLTCSTVAFATGGQAPFSTNLTSSCASENSRWGIKVNLTRDIALGQNPQKRAENVIFDVLEADTTGDRTILEEEVKAALAKEFGVEKEAFLPDLFLCLNPEEKEAEYAEWEILKETDGFHTYQGEKIRVFVDETGGYWQSREEGSVDVSVQRDQRGYILSLTVLRQGDDAYDRRSKEFERDRLTPGREATETIVTEDSAFHW